MLWRRFRVNKKPRRRGEGASRKTRPHPAAVKQFLPNAAVFPSLERSLQPPWLPSPASRRPSVLAQAVHLRKLRRNSNALEDNKRATTKAARRAQKRRLNWYQTLLSGQKPRLYRKDSLRQQPRPCRHAPTRNKKRARRSAGPVAFSSLACRKAAAGFAYSSSRESSSFSSSSDFMPKPKEPRSSRRASSFSRLRW